MSPKRSMIPLFFFLSAYLAAIAFVIPAQAQFSDITPPELVEFSFAPNSIDLSGGPQDVTVTLRVTDDLSGTSFVTLNFQSPSGQQVVRVNAGRTSGDSFDGIYEGIASFSPFVESGDWQVSGVFLRDFVGNSANIFTAVLASRGFPTALEVITDQSDVTPPQLTGIEFVPASVDVTGGDQQFEIRLSVEDAEAGVKLDIFVPFVELRSPSGEQSRFIWGNDMSQISGDANAGVWAGPINMQQFSESGDWKVVSVTLEDAVSNSDFLSEAELVSLGISGTLPVTSDPVDTTFPELTGFDFVPTVINTSTSNQLVTARMSITDDLAGADFSPSSPTVSFFEAGVRFRSPSGQQFRLSGIFNGFTLVTGTPQNGTWEGTLFFPQFSEDGTWKTDLQIKDRVRNQVALSESDLTARGLPTQLVVLRPSLEGDGSVDAAGGTVTDDTFGDNASVTFPPGALTETTDVAIDVFLEPLDIPTPSGFIAPGTKFVNISLTPEPAFPLPPPGLTVTLPLENPLVPGSPLTLYKVDEATGDLVPAESVFGGDVVGTVDPDGNSATFTGIASLSTVVGLIPDTIKIFIDIKPSGFPNSINTRSRGVIPIAILGSASFDVASVNVDTLRFGPGAAGPKHDLTKPDTLADHTNDINLDTFPDLVFHVPTRDSGLGEEDTEACVSGETMSGTPIQGCDSVRIVR